MVDALDNRGKLPAVGSTMKCLTAGDSLVHRLGGIFKFTCSREILLFEILSNEIMLL